MDADDGAQAAGVADQATLAWQSEHISFIKDPAGDEWVFSSATGERALLDGRGWQLDFQGDLAFVAQDGPEQEGDMVDEFCCVPPLGHRRHLH